MAEDPEKRFHSIMDKLFNDPPKSPSSSSVSRGTKRPSPGSALALVEPRTGGGEVSVAAGAPICRPWDRGDLMKRLATFKSMTWFAMPKVVSAVNCALRGWINVDLDTIACEACGARLLFSTPPSWTQQQVEKAALVFSLKLDNGHKMLCPWIDNACDERLAEFPPAPPQVLVEKYNERSSELLQLEALPVVSFSSTNFMRNPQLEEFLKESLYSDKEDGSVISIGNKDEADSAILYYQGQKLISLCGWEPRELPYVVDCKDREKQLVKDSEAFNLSQIVANPLDSSVSSHSAAANGIDATSAVVDLSSDAVDPNSVVLDCKLCGASVGLWTFTLLPRPVELFRLIGSAEVNSRESVGQDAVVVNPNDDRGKGSDSASSSSVADRPPSLSFTIAGGPPPTRQNFKATISFPIIGQNLRARFSYDSEFNDRKFNNQQDAQLERVGPSAEVEHGPRECGIVEQDMGMGRINNCDHRQNCQAPNSDQSSCLNHENGSIDADKEKNTSMSLVQSDVAGQDTSAALVAGDVSVNEQQEQNTVDASQGVGQSDKLLENSQEIQSGASEISERSDCLGTKDATMNSREGKAFSDAPSNLTATVDSVDCFQRKEEVPSNAEIVPSSRGKDVKQFPGGDAMQFDPIRHHRHFCPWIFATDGRVPGWQQTLSALQRHIERSGPSFSRSPQSASIVKVDDPIASFRKLFKSPAPKRLKLTHENNMKEG